MDSAKKRHESRLQACEMRYLRRVEGLTKMDQVRNEEISKRLNQETVVETMRRRQRTLKEKIEHMDEDRLARRVYEEGMPGKH